MSTATVPVVIIGAGPTGLTAATLLGQYGVECLVLDRWESIYPQPRAVHLDDEVYRILARIGLARGVRRDLPALAAGCASSTGTCACWPSSGAAPPRAGTATPRRTCSTSRNWRPSCAPTSRSTPPSRSGATPRSPTSPRTAPDRCGSRSPTGSTGVEETVPPSTCWAATAPTASSGPSIGATMRDLQLRTALARRRRRHRRRTSASGRACTRSATRSAPATYMRIGPTRYRWEFRLAAGETADDYRDIARLHPLHRAVDQGHAGGPAGDRAGWPSTPSAPRSPTGGATGGSSCSATPPTSPRRSSARAWAPACATRPTCLEARRRARRRACPRPSWTPTRPNASPTPAP